MGIYIAKGIIEAIHGGRLWAEDDPERGNHVRYDALPRWPVRARFRSASTGRSPRDGRISS